MDQKELFENIDIVTVKLVKEKDSYYGTKNIRNSEELASVVKRFLGDTDREVFLAINLSTPKTINSIHVVSVALSTGPWSIRGRSLRQPSCLTPRASPWRIITLQVRPLLLRRTSISPENWSNAARSSASR